jgi:hypothetical protein
MNIQGSFSESRKVAGIIFFFFFSRERLIDTSILNSMIMDSSEKLKCGMAHASLHFGIY